MKTISVSDIKFISTDGKKASLHNADDWRCFCDDAFKGMSQGYGMSPNPMPNDCKSEGIVYLDSICTCGRCNREFKVISTQNIL